MTPSAVERAVKRAPRVWTGKQYRAVESPLSPQSRGLIIEERGTDATGVERWTHTAYITEVGGTTREVALLDILFQHAPAKRAIKPPVRRGGKR